MGLPISVGVTYIGVDVQATSARTDTQFTVFGLEKWNAAEKYPSEVPMIVSPDTIVSPAMPCVSRRGDATTAQGCQGTRGEALMLLSPTRVRFHLFYGEASPDEPF